MKFPEEYRWRDAPHGLGVALPLGANVLAQYTIPLGANQATLVFTGSQLTPDDFDALVDFVQFSKRQFERALKSAPQEPDSPGDVSFEDPPSTLI